jgi:large subunit ribosomal protein L15
MTLEQHQLRPPRGATRPRKRVGRGNASGTGTYAGRGLKGQQARAGYSARHAFEGGQTPLVRRLPARRGFRNPFRIEYQPVNLSALAKLPADSEVTPESLREAGIVRSLRLPIKVLAEGELSVALNVKAHRVSAPARAKIEAAGGTVEELTPRKGPADRRQRKHLREAAAPKAEAQPEAEAEPAAEDKSKDDEETNDGESASGD